MRIIIKTGVGEKPKKGIIPTDGLKLRVDEIVDLELLEDYSVTISFKGEILETLPMIAFNNLFARRSKFKAKVMEFNSIMPIRYYDVHRHSGYSLLDGLNKIPALVENTEYAGAITDHGVMYGVVDYYKEMKKAGKLPVLGFEAYAETIDGEKTRNHLLLLAKSETGFKNLVKLTSLGFTNFYKKPHISYDMLKEHSEGIICSTACMGGEVPRLLAQDKVEEAKVVCETLISIFGKENFYIEVQRHQIVGEDKLNIMLIDLAKDLDVKVIATTDSHYTTEEDSYIHEILLCMQTKRTMDDEKRWKFPGTGYHLHTSEEMEKLWIDMPEVLDNTLDLVESINFELELGKVYMPSFSIPTGFKSEEEFFEFKCWEGFNNRFNGTDKLESAVYKERLEFEMETIRKMGFPGYFLIVWDFVDFAKRNGILVGPGRGSACGSLVSYCLTITEIDPIQYGLLFERFLNPDRISMPDIDLDFDDQRREEVIEYVKLKYGEKAVSKIITFGTLSARSVIRDVVRTLSKPYLLGDSIAKSIPKEPKITLKKALEQSQEFANMYNNDQEVREIVDIAMKLEGLPKNISTHACGLLIAPSAVDDYIPQVLIKNKNKDTGVVTYDLVTQYVGPQCEEAGILKMDFLGLRTMGVVGRTLKDVNKKKNVQGLKEVEYLKIPTNDIKVYDFIAKGNTEGVFQLESGGMTSFMKELFQDVHESLNVLTKEAKYKKGEELFERLIAGISLYRPGPIDEIPHYVANMLNPSGVTYEVPTLEPILNNTYGVIVYQEQVMFIVRELAGFTKGQADYIRKAMGKKISAILDKYEEFFVYGSAKHDEENPNDVLNIKGCVPNGISEDIAKGIWAKMRKFGEYAFNKSHAGGYADIAIRTAWLSFYHPTEYMCATLNSFITKSQKIKAYLSVCKRKNIQVLPPHVNASQEAFSVDGEAIRFGLMGIRNMGKTSVLVINEKNERGEFTTFQNFAERMAKYQKCDKSVLEALIYSGSVDNFEGTRKAKLSMLPIIMQNAKIVKKHFNSDQISMFDYAKEEGIQELLDIEELKIPQIEEFEKRFKLEKEKEFAGFYVTEHPLDEYVKYFTKAGVSEIGFLFPTEDDDEMDEDVQALNNDGENVKIAGIVKDVKTFYTKSNGDAMNVFTIEDRTGEVKCVAFPRDKIKNEDKIVEGKIVILNGMIQINEMGTQVIVKTMIDVDSLKQSNTPDVLWLRGSSNRGSARKEWEAITEVIENNPGKVAVYFTFGDQKHEMKCKIRLSVSVVCRIQEIMGEANVKVMYK